MSDTTSTSEPTATGTLSVGATIEQDLNIAGDVAAATAGPIGEAADTALQVGEAVVNSVESSQATHASALETATAAASTLATAAAPVVAALPATDAAKATASLGLLQTILADLKTIFGL